MSSPIHTQEVQQKSNPSSPHDLVTMQNVASVLDLHKEHHHQNQQQMSPPQQQIYHPSDLSQLDAVNGLKEESLRMLHEQQQEQTESRLISDGRIVEQHQQLLTKITGPDDPIFRLIDSGLVSKIVGENQQIVSSDYVNGEHHIVTRNINGEHTLTRIVNTSVDHGKMNGSDTDIYGSLHCGTIVNGQGVINNNKAEDKTQLIFTPDNQSSVISKNPQQPQQQQHQYDPDVQKEIDLIVHGSNKTFVYATNPPQSPGMDSKQLEIFASPEFANGQAFIQGNLQYTPQIQSDGTTVYVVSELIDDEQINGDLSR